MSKLHSTELDFSSCPEDELEQCWLWEYGRESLIVQAAVQRLREGRKRAFEDCLLTDAEQISLNTPQVHHPWAVYTYSPEWPQLPYLSLSAEMRYKRARLVMPGGKLGMEEGNRLGSYEDGRFEAVSLEIDWSKEDGTLLKAFGKWLKDRRPSGVEIITSRGKNNPVARFRVQLKQLGELRLHRATGGAETQYSEQSASIRAIRAARDVIRHHFSTVL